MESTPEPTFRELCLRCRRPRTVCWCDAVTRVPSQTHVVFLQHPREFKVAVSTCRMAHLSLPNSELHVGTTAVGTPSLEALATQEGVAVLFPSEGAPDVRDLPTPPRTLVVVDGTWANAKKVVTKCPVLSKLPRVAFSPEKPGNYRIRKEPAEHCLSTIEAVAYVLEHLEKQPGGFVPILSVFDAMVEKQLEYVRGNSQRSRHVRKKARNTVRVDPAAELKARADDLVVVFGESNAWPLDDQSRPLPDEPELVQLVALRLTGDAKFQALMVPARPLSPSVPYHLDLPATALTEPRADALARWKAFVKPSDVLVGWGPFCAALLGQEGLAPATFIDLRAVLARCSSRRPGSVETCAQLLGVELPHGQGRAARRLEALTAVARATLTGELQARLTPARPARRGAPAT